MQTSDKALKSTPTHCAYCFDVIINALNNKDLKGDKFPPIPTELDGQEAPLFVSWHTKDGDLRGCIGR